MNAALHSLTGTFVGVEEACWPSWAGERLPERCAAVGCRGVTGESSAVDADSGLPTCCMQAERARAGAAERSEAHARAKAEKASARVKQVSNAAGRIKALSA